MIASVAVGLFLVGWYVIRGDRIGAPFWIVGGVLWLATSPWL